MRGFHWERGKRARTAVVPAAAYLPATFEARTEGWAKAAASTPSIAWIETRYGNVLGRPGRDRRTPAALAFFQCDRRRGTQPGRPGRDDRAADRMAVAAAPTKNQAAYEHFLGLLPGRPQVVITDSDNAIGGAVATEGDQVTIVRNGAIVSRDRHAFLAEVEGHVRRGRRRRGDARDAPDRRATARRAAPQPRDHQTDARTRGRGLRTLAYGSPFDAGQSSRGLEVGQREHAPRPWAAHEQVAGGGSGTSRPPATLTVFRSPIQIGFFAASWRGDERCHGSRWHGCPRGVGSPRKPRPAQITPPVAGARERFGSVEPDAV